MDRIEGFGGLFGAAGHGVPKPKPQKAKKKNLTFISALDEEKAEGLGRAGLPEPDAAGGSLEDLLDGVHGAGERLKGEISLANIQAYKKAVSAFLALIVATTYELEERSSGTSISRRKKFVLIRIVNEHLERLAAQVLAGQRDQMEILRRVDEIHGVLVDLLR